MEIPLKDLKQNLCLQNGNHKALILNNSLTVVFQKGLSVILFLENALCGVGEYVKSGRDRMVIDPDPDEIYTKRKKEAMAGENL